VGCMSTLGPSTDRGVLTSTYELNVLDGVPLHTQVSVVLVWGPSDAWSDQASSSD
jgi:hypothetical protein